MTLTRIVHRQAEVNPAAPAVRAGQRQISYKEFARAIDCVACRLSEEGVKAGAFVGVRIVAPYWHWVLLLAAMRLGAATVSLISRQAMEIEALASLDFDLVVPGRAERASGAAREIVITDAWLKSASQIARLPETPASDEALARWFLSSGATGQNKAVRLAARQLALRFTHAIEANSITAKTRCFCAVGVDTIAGYNIPLATWMSGGLVILPGGPGKEGALEALAQSNLAMASPAGIEAMLKFSQDQALHKAGRTLVAVGGRLPIALKDQALERLCERLLLGYGTTEAGGVARGDGGLLDRHQGAVGYVRKEAELHIVGPDGQPLPPGEEGIVRLRTDSMAAEYVNDAKATAMAFHDGWFYPGDLGALHEDGLLVIKGRLSEVMNIGGVKLSPADIEAKLSSLDKVEDLCALAVRDPEGRDRLAIVVVCKADVDLAALRAGIQEKIERPRRFLLVQVPAIPRNRMGKIPRQRIAQQIARALEMPKSAAATLH